MERREVQPPDMPQDLAAIGKRLLDLERQVSAFRVPKIQDDLLDTEVLYQAPASPGGPAPPVDGDVLTFDGSRDSPYGGLWVPAAAGGTVITWGAKVVRSSGSWGAPDEVWSVCVPEPSPGLAPSSLTPRYVVTGSGAACAEVRTSGIYLVTVAFEGSGIGYALIKGPNFTIPPAIDCRPNRASFGPTMTGAEVDRVTVSSHFALYDEAELTLYADVDCTAFVSLHLVCALDVAAGVCGD